MLEPSNAGFQGAPEHRPMGPVDWLRKRPWPPSSCWSSPGARR